MTYQPVEAVFVVFYGLATHKATYGRDVVGDSTYTKDFIQLTRDGEFRESLEKLFPRERVGAKATRIEYRWPGGTSPGSVEFQSTDRPHLAWLKTVGAPAPWKMTANPVETSAETIPGDPSKTNPIEATQQFEDLAAHDRGQPYLVAVKLRGESNALHVRAYIRDPPPNLAFASTELLPAPVRALVMQATKSRTFKWSTYDEYASPQSPEVATAVARLEENPSLLLVGPPGTGKTVLLEQLVDFVENPSGGLQFDPDSNHDAWKEVEHVQGKARTIVLHPSYSYENLVIGLLPEPLDTGGVGVRVTTGPLVNLAHYATSSPENRALLVLDEFNRGNAAAIFGDTLALLDKDKRDRAFIDLPYSDLSIEVPDEFVASGGEPTVDSRFTLPQNLWIVAAMNTSDRSVAPLDAALRRRFTMVEMPPDYEALSLQLAADLDADLSEDFSAWGSGHVGKLAIGLLKGINRRIDAVLGIDFRLGQSNFWHVGGNTPDAALLSLANAFDHRIVQTLRLSLQDDDGALAAILRAGTPDKPVTTKGVARWREADPDLGTFGSDRLHLREVSSFAPDRALNELLRQAGIETSA